MPRHAAASVQARGLPRALVPLLVAQRPAVARLARARRRLPLARAVHARRHLAVRELAVHAHAAGRALARVVVAVLVGHVGARGVVRAGRVLAGALARHVAALAAPLGRAVAAEGAGQVAAGGAVLAGRGLALVHVHLAERAGVAGRAVAGVARHVVAAGGAVLARVLRALVHVALAVVAVEAGRAGARVGVAHVGAGAAHALRLHAQHAAHAAAGAPRRARPADVLPLKYICQHNYIFSLCNNKLTVGRNAAEQQAALRRTPQTAAPL